MGKNSNIKRVPSYFELVDVLAEVYHGLNGDYPTIKQKVRTILESTEPEKLYEKRP